ncbi:MAG: arginine--tRNA ligase [Bacillales bacterium]
MSDIIELLKSKVKKATLNAFDCEEYLQDFVVEIPRDPKIADYSTNIAMRLAKPLRQNPMMIGEKIIEELNKDKEGFSSVEIVKPGFINFKIDKTHLANTINLVLEQDDKYGHNNVGNGLRILVEYVSANPTGDLHLGHARGASWGDSICRLLNVSGYDCLREYYINDAGNQIDMLAESLISRYYEHFNREYPLPEQGYHADDVKEIAKLIAKEDGEKWLDYENLEERHNYFKLKGVDLELEKIKRDLKFFRVEFDSWIHETFFYENNNKRINDCLKVMKDRNLTYELDGALWFKTTEYGDDKDRVLVKNDGSLTYFTPDIANHVYKFERGYTKLVNLWGADHHGYVLRMCSAIEALGYPKGSLEVDLTQMVRLVENGKEVKMSKRTGNAITIRELCEDVGVDAARYIFVSHEVGAHLDFDLNMARKKTNDNPVFYAQYAYARCTSILKEAGSFNKQDKYNLLTEAKEVDLLKTLNEFPQVVGDAAKTRMPNKICNYIQKLAGYFHSYYGSYKVNDKENMTLTNERLALVKAVQITLHNAFDLIGVSSPDKM